MTHPTDDSLKPCPFCGGAASLHPRTCDKNTPYNPADRAFPIARCGQCGAEAVGKDWGRPETAASAWNRRALLAAQPAGAWLPTAENINALPEPLRDYVHQLEARCDPSGTVRENAQLKDVNKGLQIMYRNAADAAAQPAVQQPAEDAELLATVECLTDESGADYVVVLRTDRPKLYGKEHRRESAAQKVADAINNEFGRAARAAERKA